MSADPTEIKTIAQVGSPEEELLDIKYRFVNQLEEKSPPAKTFSVKLLKFRLLIEI